MNAPMPSLVLSSVLAYLLGSIPFGLLLGFLAGKDVRRHGSMNIGATNVWRVCGKAWGLAAFILDFLKGLAAVLLAGALATGVVAPYPGILAAVMAVAGHNFPVWLGFKGGKGVAVSAGVVAGLAWLPFTISFLAFAATVAIFHYISLGSMVGSVALVAAILAFTPDPLGAGLPLLLLGVVLCILIFIRHRQNIARIRAGTENRFPPPRTKVAK